MKDEKDLKGRSNDSSNESSPLAQKTPNTLDRRKFVGLLASSSLAFTIVPRHVLGGPGYTAPSDKITLGYIGIGTQGVRELLPLLANTQIQVTSVCDPNKTANGYRDWSKEGLRNEVRKAINNPAWTPGGNYSIPGGRDNGKEIVESYYASQRPSDNYKGCSSYADVREMLDKEKDMDAVKIMTPDHLHGILSIAALKKGKHILLHKPLSNRLLEGKKVIEMAKSSNAITHLIPWDSNGSMETVMAWINAGAIGTLKEVHNWTNRPVWPQYPNLPTETPPIPEGFDWDLWLGPEAYRPYSPNYTHMVFRGWYDFGGGSMADMGHYSLWTVFNALKLTSPTIIEPCRSHFVNFNDVTPSRVNNNFSFPMASMVRFHYPANGDRPPVDLCWYDGGMRPPNPTELLEVNKELPAEGMMFVGDKGKILAGFNVQKPEIISGTKMEAPVKAVDQRSQVEQTSAALPLFVDAIKTGKQYAGNFREAEAITEAINLYSASLRTNKMLRYDASLHKVTNVAEANKYLDREYREGWEPGMV